MKPNGGGAFRSWRAAPPSGPRSLSGPSRATRGFPRSWASGFRSRRKREQAAFGPPGLLRDFAGDSGRIVVVAGADHFLEGKLETLETVITRFFEDSRVPAGGR